MRKLSIIVPVFNEERTAPQVLKKLSKLKIPKVNFEIIVVDDGSTDSTASKIKNLGSKIKFIKHAKNKGKGAAVRSGIKEASGDYILIQDADLEYNPTQIKNLVNMVLLENAQVVYGTRLKRLPNLKKDEKAPLFLLHYFGNRGLSFITSLLYGQWLTDIETGYKLFSRKAVKGLKLKAKGFEIEPELTAKFIKKGYHIVEVPITTNPRSYKEGKKLRTFKDGTKALWTLIKYRFYD